MADDSRTPVGGARDGAGSPTGGGALVQAEGPRQNAQEAATSPPAGLMPAETQAPLCAAVLAGFAVKNRAAPTPAPTTATPVSRVLTSAIDRTELTSPLEQLGAHAPLSS